MGRLKTKIKQLWKSYCAPFDERLSRCKETDKNNLFLCNYFLFILPGIIIYFTYGMVALANSLLSGVDITVLINTPDKIIIVFPLLYLPFIILGVWQLLELRKFSKRFFISFIAFVVYDGIFMIFYWIFDKNPVFIKQYALHLLIFVNFFYYFWSRRNLFSQK